MDDENKSLERKILDLEKLLEESKELANYYKKISEDTGKRSLREIDHLSALIAEKKRLEQELRQESSFLNSIIEKAAEGLCVWHATKEYPYMRFIVWNDRMTDISGYTMEEINRLGWYQSVYPDPEIQAQAIELLARVRQGLTLNHEEREITRINGEKRFLNISTSSFTTTEGITHILALMDDITERKRTETAILGAKEEWERTFDAVPDLIAILDDKFRIVKTNRAMAETLGLTPDEAVGLLCYKKVHGTTEPPPFCPHAKLLLDGQAHTVEVHEEGQGGDFFVSVSPRYDYRGRLIGSVHVAHDITASKQAEAELQKTHAELEQKIYERTRELSIANEKMHQEINERRLVEASLNVKEKELKHQADHLDKINTALKVLLEHRDEEKRRLEESVFLNVKKLIIPYLDKLVAGVPNSHAKTYLDIIKINLENLISPFASKLSYKHLNLTPTEMQVADFVRNGHTNKEIALHLNVSIEAVSFHRKNIRKKLGLTKIKTNLRSYLQKLSD
jgi:PAS domain S-box-containing protein